MSIKKTLSITIILFSIIPIIIVSVVSYTLISKRLVYVKHDYFKQLTNTNSNGLKALINNQKTEINLLSNQKEIYQLVNTSESITEKDKVLNNINVKKANELLKKRGELNRSCIRITLYNTKRQVIACSDETFIGTHYSDNLKLDGSDDLACDVSGLNETIGDNNENIFFIEIGSPIIVSSIGGDQVKGYIVITLNINYFKDFLNSIKIDNTGFGILLSKSGQYIFHPNSEKIGTTSKSEKLCELVNDYSDGKIPLTGAFEYTDNGLRTIYGYSVIPELNWVLIVKQDYTEVINLANINLYILIITIILLSLVTFFTSHTITKVYTNPIIELKDTMQTAANGNLDVKSGIKFKNELGELSRSFNKMLHIIKTNYNDLTSMHEELITNEDQLRTNYNKIEYLAYHDTLTNLPNKFAFIERVNSTLDLTIVTNNIHAVYFIDLDNFKTINDTLGHDYGDAVLKITTDQLSELTTTDDLLARAGGDEFLIFRENLSSQKDATDFAAKVIDSFREPLHLFNEIIYISMSIGIAVFPKNGTTTNTLVKNADIAMYRSKDTGKNKYTLFDTSMEEELHRNTLIQEVLRHAINNKEIYVKYQPQFSISSGEIIGFEALMRINSRKLGQLSPSEFIPIAEESGLIVELGEWILREACDFNKRLLDIGNNPFIISVNISSVQMNRAGFIHMLEDVLNETQLPPKYLELEITESTLISSLVDTTTLLGNLQALGVRISLDDFGTGYSSLKYLTSLPINTLKIDKSFIDNIGKNLKDSYIAETIIRLAHNIEIEVIAEGVEYAEQLDILKKKGCDIVQGYVYSKPMLPNEVLSLLTNYTN